jgi:thioredoxin reductase (NADPH)
MTENIEFDVIILGGGGVGLAASMYASRLGMKNLVLGFSHGSELPIGGVITTTNVVENYPGFIRLTGQEIAKEIENHARDYKEFVTIKEEKATQIDKLKSCFKVKTNSDTTYKGKTIIFATGTKWKKLPETVKGSREFERKGINYCALCDGPLFKNKVVAVVGGSDSAAKDALVLAEHATKVYMIVRSTLRAEPINQQRIKANKKIEVFEGINITEVKGEAMVKSIVLDKPINGKNELALDGVFVAIGHIVLSDLAKPLGVKIDKKGEIVINHKTSETNVPGVFAAGDVTDKEFKQLITGVADGCTASYYAYEFISKNKEKLCY